METKVHLDEAEQAVLDQDIASDGSNVLHSAISVESIIKLPNNFLSLYSNNFVILVIFNNKKRKCEDGITKEKK